MCLCVSKRTSVDHCCKFPKCFFFQILFNNAASRSSHAIKIDDETFVQCVQSVDYVGGDSDAKYKSCYVGAARYIKKGSKVKIIDQYKERWVNFGKTSSYWGLVRMSQDFS